MVRSTLRGAPILAVALVLMAGAPAEAVPPPGIDVLLTIAGDHCAVSASFNHAVLGQSLLFTNNTGLDQTVSEQAGFWSFAVPADAFDQDPIMTSAGTFEWTCDGGGHFMSDPVIPTAPGQVGGKFTLRWAGTNAPGSYHYSVQYKLGASGAVKTWRNDVAARSAVFTPAKHGVYYYFRGQSIRTSTARSGWSPWKKVHVT